MMNGTKKSDSSIVCARQRMSQEGSSPSGARLRGAVSKGGVMPRRPAGLLAGGQGVRSDPVSEGFEEKYRAVIEWGRPLMNRSAKDGIRSSPHYWGEGVTHSPIAPRCLLAARYGRFMRDPRRPVGVLVLNRVSDPISEKRNGKRCTARSRRT